MLQQNMDEFPFMFTVVILPSLLCLIFVILVLACFGRSLGIRRKYVTYLLTIFEWGRKEIEEAKKQSLLYETLDEEAESDEEGPVAYIPKHPLPSSARKVSLVPLGETFEDSPVKIEPVVIKREASIRILSKLCAKQRVDDFGSFVLRTTQDMFDFIKAGIEAIIEDDVTNRFEAEELACWNLLTRTSYGYHLANWKLCALWFCGFLWRYCVLFPVRLTLFAVALVCLVVCTAALGYLDEGPLKRYLNRHVNLMCYRILSRALSTIMAYHNEENMAKPGGICVANHTSPIDVLMLACNNCYALVGQRHGGILGIAQRALNRASSHIWFERSESQDRAAVAERLRNHVGDKNKLPILIFPEGTCINNTSVMMFKKGSFEVGATIYPVAIKYDPRFGDPFWNSAKQTWMHYLIHMMTSWAIVCDVYFLPPMERKENEDAISFANRVKRKIAKAGGLVDLDWDGQLKRCFVPDKLKEKTKELYAKRVEKAAMTVYDNAGSANTNEHSVKEE